MLGVFVIVRTSPAIVQNATYDVITDYMHVLDMWQVSLKQAHHEMNILG